MTDAAQNLTAVRLSREDMRCADKAAVRINQYWRARGVRAHARVADNGAVISIFSRTDPESPPKVVGSRPRKRRGRIAPIVLAALQNEGANGATATEIVSLTRLTRLQVHDSLMALKRARRVYSEGPAGKAKTYFAALQPMKGATKK